MNGSDEPIGCELLENKYINSQSTMKFKCKCGNESSINFDNFKNRKNDNVTNYFILNSD